MWPTSFICGCVFLFLCEVWNEAWQTLQTCNGSCTFVGNECTKWSENVSPGQMAAGRPCEAKYCMQASSISDRFHREITLNEIYARNKISAWSLHDPLPSFLLLYHAFFCLMHIHRTRISLLLWPSCSTYGLKSVLCVYCESWRKTLNAYNGPTKVFPTVIDGTLIYIDALLVFLALRTTIHLPSQASRGKSRLWRSWSAGLMVSHLPRLHLSILPLIHKVVSAHSSSILTWFPIRFTLPLFSSRSPRFALLYFHFQQCIIHLFSRLVGNETQHIHA